jgi:hypothetical protein
MLTHLRTAPECAPLGPDEHVLEVELDLIRYAHHRLECDLHENPPSLPRKSGTKWPEHHDDLGPKIQGCSTGAQPCGSADLR